MTRKNYYNWRSDIAKAVPDNLRVGDDLFILENKDFKYPYDIPRKVDASTFILLDKGKSKVVVEGVEYEIQSPCITMILPEQTYCIHYCEGIEFRAIIMSRQYSESLFEKANMDLRNLYEIVRKRPILQISSEIISLNAYYKSLLGIIKFPFATFKLESTKHLLISMIYYFVNKLEVLEEKTKRQDIIFERFCFEVRQYYKVNRSPIFYAGRLGISSKYLTDIVKQHCGETASEYVERQIIIEAKALLASTKMSVQQISHSLNFPSSSVFGKFFKRIEGVSPSEYREGLL